MSQNQSEMDEQQVEQEEGQFEQEEYSEKFDRSSQMAYYVGQKNCFWSHFSKLSTQDKFKAGFAQDASSDETYTIVQFNTGKQTKFKLLPQISENLDASYIKSIRRQLECDDEQFNKLVLQQILSRRNLLVSSPSFQHRVQFREIACSAIVSFLSESFMRRQAFLRQHVIAEQIVLLKEEEAKRQNFSDKGAKRLLDAAYEEASEAAPESNEDEINVGNILQKLSKTPETLKEAVDFDDIVQPRCAIFTRPQVLIVVPTKAHCWRLVQLIIALFPNLTPESTGGFERFEKEFAPTDDVIQFQLNEEVSVLPDEVPDFLISKLDNVKPLEFLQMVGGNNDDAFVLPMSFGHKSLKTARLYTKLEDADLVFLSPNGFVQSYPVKDMNNITKAEVTQFDPLACVHTVLLDSLDLLIEQNYVNLKQLLSCIHTMPALLGKTNVGLLTEPIVNGQVFKSCQFIAFQAQQSEFSAELFAEDGVGEPITDVQVGKLRYDYQNLRLSYNQYGTSQLLYLLKEPPINYLKGKATFHNVSNTLNLTVRNSDLYTLKIDVKRFPRIDFAVNYLFSTVKGQRTIVYAHDYFTFYRLKHVMEKMNLKPFVFTDEMRLEDAQKLYGKYRHVPGSIALVSEKFHYYRRFSFNGTQNIICVGCPRYISIIQQMSQQVKGKIMIVFDEVDRIKMQNLCGGDVNGIIRDLYLGRSYEF